MIVLRCVVFGVFVRSRFFSDSHSEYLVTVLKAPLYKLLHLCSTNGGRFSSHRPLHVSR